MLNLIFCEVLKLKRSKMLPLSILGALATPILMLFEALQTYFEHPEQSFTLNDIYQNSLLYVMLLMNMLVYVAITAYLFSREYTEKTLKTILPIPVSRNKLVTAKFFTLLLWIIMLSIISWIGSLVLSTVYHYIFGLDGFHFATAFRWFLKFLISGILMFFTISPYAFIAEKAKSLVAPMILSAVMVMGNVALSNQNFGALYPWTATFFLLEGKTQSTGYSILLSVGMIFAISVIGFYATFRYFKGEDLK